MKKLKFLSILLAASAFLTSTTEIMCAPTKKGESTASTRVGKKRPREEKKAEPGAQGTRDSSEEKDSTAHPKESSTLKPKSKRSRKTKTTGQEASPAHKEKDQTPQPEAKPMPELRGEYNSSGGATKYNGYTSDDERLIDEYFSPDDFFPGGKLFGKSKAEIVELARNAATNAKMVKEQRAAKRLAEIRPADWHPEIDRLPTGRKANHLLRTNFYIMYLREEGAKSFYGEFADPLHPRFIYSNLRAYVWDKYVKGKIEELPREIVELRKRQQDGIYDDEDEREGPDEIDEEEPTPTLNLWHGSAMPFFGYSYNGM